MRRLIYQDFENLLSKHYDVLITPTTVGPAPSVSSFHQLGPVQSNVYDTFTVPVSLAGKFNVYTLVHPRIPLYIPGYPCAS